MTVSMAPEVRSGGAAGFAASRSLLPASAPATTDTTAPAAGPGSGDSPVSVQGVEFSRELRNDVLAGEITVSVRLWNRPRVKQGGSYRVGPGEVEVDAIELVPSAAITEKDVRRAGEPDRETLRQRAAHARADRRGHARLSN